MAPLYILVILLGAALARPNIDVSEDRLDNPDERGELFEGDMLDYKPQKRNAIFRYLWPNGRIPYQFDPQYESQFTSTDKARIQEAFSDYAKYTCVRIVPKTSSDTAYINIIRGNGCYSNVGTLKRKQTISLGRGCTGKGTIIHEFMHAAGFHHEQGRTDRDDYVTIKWENISPGMESQFTKYTTSQVQDLGAPYDYGSVMHYSAYAFSKNRQVTIVPKQTGAKIGNRAGFSQIDIFKINQLYNCANPPTLPPYSTLQPGQTTKSTPSTPRTTPAPSIVSERFACDFESGLCGFRGSASDNFDWTRYSGLTPSAGTGPNGDHTTRSGYYMYTEASNPRKVGEKAHLMSPEFRGTVGRVYCLSFWYSMNGTTVGTLNVFNKPAGTTSATGIFTKDGNQGNAWRNAKIAITYSKPFHFVFEGIIGSNFLSDIAIDDVSIAPGSCGQIVTTRRTTQATTKATTKATTRATPPTTQKPTVLKSGFSCNFDANNCGFVQNTNDDFDWTRITGATSSSATGPTSDRSGNGAYFYTEASSPAVAGNIARLTSPTMTVNGLFCLEFSYHMYGVDMGEMKVYSVSGGSQRMVFQKKGDQGNQWKIFRSQVSLSGMSQIMFESIRGSSFRGDAAIDDVSVSSWPGRCSAPGTTSRPVTSVPSTQAPVTGLKSDFKCDFDSDFCKFTQPMSDKFDWVRQSGSTSSSSTGPSGDHTSGSGQYVYIEASSPRVTGDHARLVSPNLDYSGQRCVSFWMHMYGSAIGTLKVFNKKGSSESLLYSKSGNNADAWNLVQLNVAFSGVSQIVFEGIRGSGFSGDIALDDVSITSGQCKTVAVTTPKVTTKPTQPTTVNPFSGNTLYCNFDQSFCGFTQNTDDEFDWSVTSGSTPSGNTGPTADHSSGAGRYAFIEASSPRVQGDTAVMATPPITGYGQYCLQYWYHTYGSGVGALTVSKLENGYQSKLNTHSGDLGDKWVLSQVLFAMKSPTKIVFEASVGSSFSGDIAIDDVVIRPGVCSQVGTNKPPATTPSVPTTATPWECHFEKNTCGMTMTKPPTSGYEWARQTGQTSSGSTGPITGDHTLKNPSGSYMFAEASSPASVGHKAWLETPLFGAQKTCMKFFYNMNGLDIDRLNVYLGTASVFQNKPFFTAFNHTGDVWQEKRIGLSSDAPFKVRFEAIRGPNYRGDIAIDDISFSTSCDTVIAPPVGRK